MNMEKQNSSARMPDYGIGRPIYILKLLGVAVLYALLAKVVLTLFAANGVVSIVWPPSGLALAVLLIGGKRYFPGVFLGAFIANAMTGLAFGVAAAIAMGNTLEALLGVWLLTRNGRFDSSIRALSDYLRLVVLGGFVACSVAALNGSTTLLVSGFITHDAYIQNLFNWWMGDVLGIVLITPLILAWRRIPDGWLNPKRTAEAILLLGLTFLANQIVFLEWFHDPSSNTVFEQVAQGYWMFLFAALVATRFGIYATVIALVMTTIQALSGAAMGVGFFAHDIASTGLTTFWFYMMTLSVVGMALATHFTERKHAVDALRHSEENLNRAQAVGQIGSWFLDIPTNRLEWSAETYRMFGIPQQKAIDLETFVAVIHPDDRNLVLKAWSDSMAGAPYDIEHRIVAGGQERWVRERARIERDAEGRPLTGIGTVQDITERKLARDALRASENKFRTLFEEMVSGFALHEMVFDKDGKPVDYITLDVNREFERLLNTTRESVIGKKAYETVPGLDRKWLEIFGKVVLTKVPCSYEEYAPNVEKWFAGTAFCPEDGKVAGTFIDITERKKYEEELKRSNTELEQFSYVVSHDMRQPLRMISSYLQLIELNLADQLDSEKRGYFDFAIEGAKRVDRMLVALLEYSRVGKMGEPPAWIESRAMLDEALQYLNPALTEAQARLDITGEWPRIFASHDEMQRLIQNLIGNAVKFRVAGRIPEITVTSKLVRNEWNLCIADNGIGIIPGQIKRLFQVFQRLQSRDAYEGTGIGLALCRKIAEHHKGSIWAESTGEGQGSKFWVVLPVPQEKAISSKGGAG